ncbi:hypothetical protein EUTSA_v10027241mg [Eutrema salsugineum]|uniref:KIB1-4 beta-propeller domain-containing protein n=1 Tax=Eutrema salsugineum TaxID=72664 RepID=V4LSG6_EUTSA|nr:F-box protein At4g35733 [Eutrema salsugineum]ESQ53520.1 hypothetical protein EUTSA_v10027241mg [Eutrema salsugineum]
MSKSVEWSDLLEELLDLIANRVFSNVELLRVRSICKSWRSAVATNKSFPNRRNRNRRRFLSHPYGISNEKKCLLSPAALFRVIHSSCPNKGWLLKTQDVSDLRKKLLFPLSRLVIDSSHKTLDLLEFTVSEIHQSYDAYEYWEKDSVASIKSYGFARVVLVDNLVFAVDRYKKLWWCNSGEESNNDHVWTRMSDEEAEYFSDIIVHKGQVYALDLKGAIWWVSLSELKIYQYGPNSTPTGYYDSEYCREYLKDMRLVEHCGDLCIVYRFCEILIKRPYSLRTIGFKVYKMDEELVKWVQVNSLGDKAFVMATDICFSVLASEYYACLENSIYFTDEEDINNAKVFKFGDGPDGSIIKNVNSSSENCFQMFSPPFV